MLKAIPDASRQTVSEYAPKMITPEDSGGEDPRGDRSGRQGNPENLRGV